MMCLCLVFSGCEKKNSGLQQALNFRRELLESSACSFTCHIEAEMDDWVYQFSVDCRADDEGILFEVTAPEEISGITASLRNGEAQLEFNGLALDFGTAAQGRVSPLTTPSLLCSAWSREYIQCAGADGDACRVTYLCGYDEDEITVDTWFADASPSYAEISWDGKRILAVTIADFSLEH